MIRKAIDKCGRPMVLSLSPGPAVIDKAWHLRQNANMWRITDDLLGPLGPAAGDVLALRGVGAAGFPRLLAGTATCCLWAASACI